MSLRTRVAESLLRRRVRAIVLFKLQYLHQLKALDKSFQLMHRASDLSYESQRNTQNKFMRFLRTATKYNITSVIIRQKKIALYHDVADNISYILVYAKVI